MVAREEMDKILAGDWTVAKIHCFLLEGFFQSGKTLEDLAKYLDVSVETCFEMLHDREGLTLRRIGELSGAIYGNVPDFRMKDLRVIREQFRKDHPEAFDRS